VAKAPGAKRAVSVSVDYLHNLEILDYQLSCMYLGNFPTVGCYDGVSDIRQGALDNQACYLDIEVEKRQVQKVLCIPNQLLMPASFPQLACLLHSIPSRMLSASVESFNLASWPRVRVHLPLVWGEPA
jgi:hypothetical protein